MDRTTLSGIVGIRTLDAFRKACLLLIIRCKTFELDEIEEFRVIYDFGQKSMKVKISQIKLKLRIR